MANSSMFALPTMTAPAAVNLSATVAEYGGTNPVRILLPAVVAMPSVQMLSFSATGMPVRIGRPSAPAPPPALAAAPAAAPDVAPLRAAAIASSARSAAAMAPASSTVMKAPTVPSYRRMRSSEAPTSSRADMSPRSNMAWSSLMLCSRRSVIATTPPPPLPLSGAP
ncbi:MAG: hypothetical protein BWY85_02280 [Firmicutes bacterium ADurb.Bin506]|nr:MAG: hypothetical protein BWY85_02280 [Firmicutes bacterium ADurb.Bin506]